MTRKIVLVVSFLLAFSFRGISQKIYNAQGTAKVRLEEHMSRQETRDLARQQARQQAIETIFGTYVSKDAYVDVSQGSAQVTVYSTSELKGEWLKTNDESFEEESRKIKDEFGTRHEIWIVCKVKGKVREIESPLIGYSFKTQNCPEETCEVYEYENGESFYLSFQTPEDGYLSVYLVDETQAYRILPYQEMPSAYLHTIPVEADRAYTFFAAQRSFDYFEDYNYFLSDEIYLETEKSRELFKVYVLFSPKPFSKPFLNSEEGMEGEYDIPKTLKKRNFEVWVQDNRIFDTNFYYQTKNIFVSK